MGVATGILMGASLLSVPLGARQGVTRPADTATSYARCYEPKTSARGIEVREVRVDYNAQRQIFTVSSCLVSNLRDLARISPTYTMHRRDGSRIGAMGQPKDAPPIPENALLGSPYMQLASAVEIPVGATTLDLVRPEVYAVIAWTDTAGGHHTESYSIPFTFIPK